MSTGVHSLTLLCAALALPAWGAEAFYDAAARTDVRTRTPLPGDVTPYVSGDLELLPALNLGLKSTTAGFTLRYDPDILFREPQALGPVSVLHRGRAMFAKRWERTGLTLLQEGAIGTLDVGALRPLDGAVPGDYPVVETLGLVPYQRSNSWITFDATPNDRLGLSFTAAYLISGSPGVSYRLPLQWGPLASARLRWSPSRLDTFTTTARGFAAWFVTGQEQQVVTLMETWDRRLSNRTTLSLGAGPAFTREVIPVLPIENPPIPGTYRELLPTARVALTWEQPVEHAPAKLEASVRMAPYADRFSAFVYERLEGRLTGEWQPAKLITVNGDTGAAWAVPVGNPVQAGDGLLFAEGAVTWNMREWLALGFSARVLWTVQPRFNPEGDLQALGVFSATFRDRDSTTW